jgi:hypothetical protein
VVTKTELPLSVKLLRRAVTQSGRRSTVQFDEAFARLPVAAPSGAPDPWLAQLVRAGEVQLKMYLTLVMMTLTPPHDLHRSPPEYFYAEMFEYDRLSDDDPRPGSGTRRIHRALQQLSNRGLITITPNRNSPPLISVHHVLGPDGFRPPYITLPIGLWRQGWINQLAAPGLGVLIAMRLVGHSKGDTEGFWISPDDRRRYKMSDDTWRRGVQELQELGLLEVRSGVMEDRWNWERRRNLYFLKISKLGDELAPAYTATLV